MRRDRGPAVHPAPSFFGDRRLRWALTSITHLEEQGDPLGRSPRHYGQRQYPAPADPGRLGPSVLARANTAARSESIPRWRRRSRRSDRWSWQDSEPEPHRPEMLIEREDIRYAHSFHNGGTESIMKAVGLVAMPLNQ